MRTIGIDLAVTAAHKAVVMAENGQFVTPVISFRSRWAEIEELVARAREGVEVEHPLRAVMEPTGMAWLSVRRGNIGLRLASYLLQLYACSSLVYLLWTTDGTRPSLIGAFSSGLLATIAFAHYFWSQRNPATAGETLLHKLNKNDRDASMLLIAALFSGFFTMRVGLYQALDFLHAAKRSNFDGAQSVLINVTAIAVLWVSLLRRNKELRNVAVLLIIIGAGKVFLMDMMSLKGMPLLASVFTFGLVAAFASFVLGRWGKTSEATRKEPH